MVSTFDEEFISGLLAYSTNEVKRRNCHVRKYGCFKASLRVQFCHQAIRPFVLEKMILHAILW
jgi:hypothetical protein